MEDISEYEQMRLERIARNKEKLAQLNLPTLVMELQDQVNRTKKKAAPTTKGTKRAKLTPTERPPPRRSSRVQGLQSDGAHIIAENRDKVITSGGDGSSPVNTVEREKYPAHPISFSTGNLTTDAAFLDLLKASASPITSSSPHGIKSSQISYTNLEDLSVAEENVAKLTLKGTSHLDFHPTESALIVAAGDKAGNVGIWMVDHHNLQIKTEEKEEMEEKEETDAVKTTSPADNNNTTNSNASSSSSSFEGIFNFMPHYSYISGLKWSSPTRSVSSSKLFTSAYDGSLRILDPERAEFLLAYGDKAKEYSCMDISPNGHIAYLGDKNGDLDIIDLRSRVQLAHNVELHGKKINTLQISAGGGEEDRVLLSASTDTTVAIWDMRKLHGKKDTVAGKQAEVSSSGNEHRQSCQAAYWAPDGSKKVVSTSFDDTVVFWDAKRTKMEVLKKVKHDNNTGRYILPFRAVWWNNSDAVVMGGMKRTVDVISSSSSSDDGKGGGVNFALESEYMTAIPSRHCVHPTLPVLASATGSGRVHIFK